MYTSGFFSKLEIPVQKVYNMPPYSGYLPHKRGVEMMWQHKLYTFLCVGILDENLFPIIEGGSFLTILSDGEDM